MKDSQKLHPDTKRAASNQLNSTERLPPSHLQMTSYNILQQLHTYRMGILKPNLGCITCQRSCSHMS